MKTVRHIRQMKLEVQSKCQYDCNMCAHGEQRKELSDYELDLSDLTHFLEVSKNSGYFVENIRLHGPGEPLLWHNFNEGVKMIKASGVVGTIFVATNGLLLKRITEEAWNCIDEMRVSVYEPFKDRKLLDSIIERFPKKVHLNEVVKFRRLPVDGEEAEIPCTCICDGPMLIGKRIFLYCGPPVFEAARLLKKRAMDDSKLSVEIQDNWLDFYDVRQFGNMEYCRRCWANKNFSLEAVAHDTKGGMWKSKEHKKEANYLE